MKSYFPLKNYVLFICIVSALCSCASYRMRVANDYYEQNAFIDAIPMYKKVLSKQKNSIAMIKLADCLRQTNNNKESEQWYKKVMNIRQQRPIDKFYYAQVLMKNGKYAEAKTWLEVYSHYVRGDHRLQKLMESCDSLTLFYNDTNRYNITLLKLNSPGTSNFAPAFYRLGIIFSSDRNNPDKKNLRNPLNGKGFTDLYYTKKTERGNWLDPELLRGDINGLYNDGPAAVNKDGNTMYLTRNNYLNSSSELEKNKKNFNVLKVYKSNVDGNGWKITGEMPFCSDDYSVGHAVINNSGNTIYFASDMPWGYGGTDLYMVKWVNGRWTNPQNLGATINSSGNEMFPFIQNDTILYFSSDGNYGLGGMDIYQSFFDGTSWSEPHNLGYPINTSFDDTGLIIDSSDFSGYFCSNRLENTDKIFAFEKAQPTLTISGVIYDATNNQPLANSSVLLKCKDVTDTIINTNQAGSYFLSLKVNRSYTVSAMNKDYYYASTDFNTFGKRESAGATQNFGLKPVILNKPVIWREISFYKKETELKAGAFHELDVLADQLKHNPGLKIELNSYTDSRGSDQENLSITQKRAEACLAYLIAQGIASSRIHANGYGETKLLNNCGNGILCLDEEHAENNRIEIKVIANVK